MPELTVIPYFDTPPEHCSSCFYWEKHHGPTKLGTCRRHPIATSKDSGDWCGEHATLGDGDLVVRTFA